jgi:hypothetical protein
LLHLNRIQDRYLRRRRRPVVFLGRTSPLQLPNRTVSTLFQAPEE